jgi:hypothetical protein
MTNNKQQTAVEWQFEQLFNSFEKFNNGEYTFDEYLKSNLEIRAQAKEMEKQQAIKLHYEYELYVMMNESVVMTFGQFYKQTYGGGEQC